MIDLNLPRPKDDDLSWTIKNLNTGKWESTTKPPYVTDIDQTTKDMVDMTIENKEENQISIFDFAV